MPKDVNRTGPIKTRTTLKKWPGPDAHKAGDEPDEVIEREFWHEPDGTLIEDPERIAALEERLEQERQKCH